MLLFVTLPIKGLERQSSGCIAVNRVRRNVFHDMKPVSRLLRQRPLCAAAIAIKRSQNVAANLC